MLETPFENKKNKNKKKVNRVQFCPWWALRRSSRRDYISTTLDVRTFTGVTFGSTWPLLLGLPRLLRAVLAAVGAVSLDSLLGARLLGCGAAAVAAATAPARGLGFSLGVIRFDFSLVRTRLQRCANSSV